MTPTIAATLTAAERTVRILRWAAAIAFVCAVIVVAVLLYASEYAPLTSADQFEWNLLTSTLRDWERPTEANAFIRAEECRDWERRAERYRAIDRAFVGSKVDRYAEICRKMPR